MAASHAKQLALSREYREAAEEHLERLEYLHDRGFYALSHYIAGVAVECVLRAHLVMVDPEFDARHDIIELRRGARFFDFVPHEAQESVAAALGEVTTRWSNNHRYRSGASVLRYLKTAKLDRRVKGDALKYSSHRIVSASIHIVTMGLLRWKN